MAVIRARAYSAGDVLVIRNEGPKGGPGMREMQASSLSNTRAAPSCTSDRSPADFDERAVRRQIAF
jgi:Dehydratase family